MPFAAARFCSMTAASKSGRGCHLLRHQGETLSLVCDLKGGSFSSFSKGIGSNTTTREVTITRVPGAAMIFTVRVVAKIVQQRDRASAPVVDSTISVKWYELPGRWDHVARLRRGNSEVIEAVSRTSSLRRRRRSSPRLAASPATFSLPVSEARWGRRWHGSQCAHLRPPGCSGVSSACPASAMRPPRGPRRGRCRHGRLRRLRSPRRGPPARCVEYRFHGRSKVRDRHRSTGHVATNAYLPGLIAERYAGARIVAFSTGNVYPLSPASGQGPNEDANVAPIGEYAQAALARERMLESLPPKSYADDDPAIELRHRTTIRRVAGHRRPGIRGAADRPGHR